VALQLVVGVSVPLVAALVPVVGGARTTAHRAISTHGIGTGFGEGWIDKLIGGIRHLPRPMALSLRNTFRRKARVALTLLTLTLGGVIFTMTMSANDSFYNTIEIIFDQLGDDISLYFDRPYHVSRIIGVAESVDGVQKAEVWNGKWATLPLVSGEEAPVYLRGVPADTTMFEPRIIDGRSLLPGDDRAVLVNHRLAADEGIQVGDKITLKIAEEEAVWTVVGLSLNINSGSDDFFVPFDTLAQMEGLVGRGTYVKIVCGSQDLAVQKNLIKALKDAYKAQRIEVTGHWCTSEGREQNRATFGIMMSLLLSMAALAAAVGSIGLASTMSINVVERAREIGVMRAVGASSVAVASVFVAEGVFLGLLSWLFAVPISLPGSRVFSDVLGSAVINFPLEFVYSMNGMILWFVIVVALSALASLWPALRATKVSVREALAYE
jgi:putative ABC transport system permease protein